MKEYIFVPNASPAFRRTLKRGLIDEAQLHGMYVKHCPIEAALCEVYDVDVLPDPVKQLVEQAGGSYPVVYVGSYDMSYSAIYAAGDYDEETAARNYLHASVPSIYLVEDKALAQYYATEYEGPQQSLVRELGEEILKEMNERNTEENRAMKIKFKKINSNAVTPKQCTNGAAGFDLTAVSVKEDALTVWCDTGIAVEIPKGYVGLLFPRSSVYKTGLSMANAVGVIDSDFRAAISAVFYKRRQYVEPYKAGDRVAQLVIVPIANVEFVEVDKLSETERGAGGFGSTGR